MPERDSRVGKSTANNVPFTFWRASVTALEHPPQLILTLRTVVPAEEPWRDEEGARRVGERSRVRGSEKGGRTCTRSVVGHNVRNNNYEMRGYFVVPKLSQNNTSRVILVGKRTNLVGLSVSHG